MAKKKKENSWIYQKKNRGILTLIVFFVFVFGIVVWQQVFRLPTHLFSAENIFIGSFDFDGISEELPKSESFLSDFAAENLGLSWKEIQPWSDEKIFIGKQNNGAWMAIKIKNRQEENLFWDEQLIDGEFFKTEKVSSLTTKKFSYSSPLVLAYWRSWVIVYSSQETFEKEIKSREKISQKSAFKHFNRNAFFNGWIRSSATIRSLEENSLPIEKTLLIALAKTLPSISFSIRSEEDGWSGSVKAEIDPKLYQALQDHNTDLLVPETAHLVPDDVLFFINGVGIDQKYNHTKKFLNALHEQLGIIFEGALSAQFHRYFDSSWDLKTDFLHRIRGEYAFVADQEDGINVVSFLSGFANVTTGKEEKFFSLLKQDKIIPQKKETGSLGGKKQISWTTKPLSEVIPETIQAGKHLYFKMPKGFAEENILYGFLNRFLVFSTHELGIKKLFFTAEKKIGSLAENPVFRRAILYEFPSSSGYGFVNLNKLRENLEWVNQITPPEKTLSLPEGSRLIFSKKIEQGSAFLYWRLVD